LNEVDASGKGQGVVLSMKLFIESERKEAVEGKFYFINLMKRMQYSSSLVLFDKNLITKGVVEEKRAFTIDSRF
jgi:hypothetical protein